MKLSKNLLRHTLVALTLSTPFGLSNLAMADTQTKTAVTVQDVTTLIDSNLADLVKVIPPQFALITRESLDETRLLSNKMFHAPALDDLNVTSQEITTEDGKVTVHIYRSDKAEKVSPGILWIHGGGYIMGTAESQNAATFAREMDATVVSVDYRLAPEHPFPAGVNDSTAALRWMADNAESLGIDPERIVIGGESAGAGMAAGVVLRNRDEKGPKIALQLLLYPMLDNLHDTHSGSLEGYPLWDRQTSFNAWEMYLNGTPGAAASPYASASRAKDLRGLPPVFITVGTADMFRDENINYAKRLMAAGVPTQLAVFPGIFHGGESFAPNAPVSKAMIGTYKAALKAALYPEKTAAAIGTKAEKSADNSMGKPANDKKVLATYPKGSFLENLEVQSDGSVLFTNPFANVIERLSTDGKTSTFAKLKAFPLSIISTDDGYLVAAHGKSLLKDATFMDSMQFVTLDHKGKQTGQFAAPKAMSLNGMVMLKNGQVLAADSVGGTIWAVDAKKKTVMPWINDKLLTQIPDQKMFMPGANGLKLRADGIAVSNTSRGTLLQIKVGEDGKPAGKPTLLAEIGMIDDFWVQPDNAIIFTTHGNELKRLTQDGNVEMVMTEGCDGCTAVAPYPADQSKTFIVLNDGNFYFGTPKRSEVFSVTVE